MSMQSFYTRDKANEGVKLPLFTPTGEESEYWLRVRGIDSDAFKIANAKSKRKAKELAQIEDETERTEAIDKEETELIASLIVDWNFEEECTHDNVVKFLTNAPQIANVVNTFAAKRSLFFGNA